MPLLGSGKINYVQIAEDMEKIDEAEESDETGESEDH
jgi:hypothetical protein